MQNQKKDRIGSTCELIDCRGKEALVILRKGGDIALEVHDCKGNIEFTIWFQLKPPCQKHYNKLIEIFESVKKHLIQRTIGFYSGNFEPSQYPLTCSLTAKTT